MTFKIWHKLALILILTITMAVVISTALSQRSFKSSFLEYVQLQEQQKLENLGNSLLSRYEEEGGWEFIRNKRRVWLFYLRLKPEQFRNRDFSENDQLSRRAKRQERFALRQEKKLLRAIPLENNEPKLNNFRNTIALLDENKQMIVGSLMPPEKTDYFPLVSDGDVVAYIQRKKFAGITNRLDKIFANKQDESFLFNALSTLLISVLVAVLISIYFQKRIKVLTHIAKQLTSGHYQERVIIKQKDELGQLGLDFNKLAKTLQINQQSQQQWIADISHELRTPIAILKGELQALDDGIRPLNQDAIRSLTQETERLNKLVEDLYQLSVSDLGALKYERESFQLLELLNEIKGNFALQFEQKNLNLILNHSISSDFLFNGDKQRLHQLLSNLLQNSLRYTDSGGQVCIECQENNETVIISISDSSPGVEAEKLSKIFDRLFRVENSRARTNGGAGLGLAIAKQIVLAHHGKIVAKSSDLGGITITIVLPSN